MLYFFPLKTLFYPLGAVVTHLLATTKGKSSFPVKTDFVVN